MKKSKRTNNDSQVQLDKGNGLKHFVSVLTVESGGLLCGGVGFDVSGAKALVRLTTDSLEPSLSISRWW
jgi:hypothetical protein